MSWQAVIRQTTSVLSIEQESSLAVLCQSAEGIAPAHNASDLSAYNGFTVASEEMELAAPPHVLAMAAKPSLIGPETFHWDVLESQTLLELRIGPLRRAWLAITAWYATFDAVIE